MNNLNNWIADRIFSLRVWRAKLKMYLVIARLCLRWTRKLNLGDIVVYRGKRYVLNQGVCDPSWDMFEVGGSEYLTFIHRDKFRKERTLRNFIHDIRSCYRFYKGYWFDIWVRDEVEKYYV